MLKNTSTLVASVPIYQSIKLGFVSLNGRTETYFVDRLCVSFITFITGTRCIALTCTGAIQKVKNVCASTPRTCFFFSADHWFLAFSML